MSKKTKELRQKKTEELEAYVKDMKLELLKVNGKLSSGTQLEKPSKVSELKKNVAVALSLLQERKGAKQKA